MKMIEQKYKGLEIYIRTSDDDECEIEQNGNYLFIDKQGAAELIKVLQEWVNENECAN